LSLEHLTSRIRDAAASGMPLRLRGGGTKDFYGGRPRGELLELQGYAGIVSYEPTELVVTARCGTSLRELESVLHEKRQFLPFEPPHFGEQATVGGCVAAGLAGPRRASVGAIRDFVLGAKVIDGRGRLLGFGGQVMKNVAGYDISRLLAGSLGTLALIAEVSIKVLPLPQAERSLRLELAEKDAIDALNRWAGQPLPITGSVWHEGTLTLRLSGAEPAVRAAAGKLGGAALAPSEAERFWNTIREHSHAFFSGTAPLWRIALPSTHPPLALDGPQLVEWGGGLRWLRSGADAAGVRAAARNAKGHATLFRADDKTAGVFSPLEPVLMRLHRELKAAFDPAGILNPGRLQPEL
jgi:glycolate oxidase FAD binding subunit